MNSKKYEQEAQAFEDYILHESFKKNGEHYKTQTATSYRQILFNKSTHHAFCLADKVEFYRKENDDQHKGARATNKYLNAEEHKDSEISNISNLKFLDIKDTATIQTIIDFLTQIKKHGWFYERKQEDRKKDAATDASHLKSALEKYKAYLEEKTAQ
ncbi:hypothetical protein KIM372_15700 [Bombiscardovia nodaiensis]|uniref:Uncharacterized protein n=1 Tax=Bombiscardovia nodaiensis TaxID=2932181 RepID=A0ABM8BA27_9BIFI|nr:hypothetical protein KIM372_15700 [Bombiscardovia nodaiensis]